MTSVSSLPDLITLEVAVRSYAPGVLTVDMLRAWVRRGELPATRAGKHYLISPGDLAARLAPKLRTTTPRPARETPSTRAARQLAAAGIASSK